MRYVIFVPRGEQFAVALQACLEYADTTGWESEGVVIGRWDAVLTMLMQRKAEVVIIADRSHLPPDRIPRIVVAGEELVTRPVIVDPGDPPPNRRRPRQIRR